MSTHLIRIIQRLAVLSIIAFTFASLANGAGIKAQIFGGDGLVGGLGAAKGELGGSGVRTDADFISAIAAIVNFALQFAAVFAFVAFVSSGFLFILGFGSDTSIQRAKKIMIWSAVGLVVVIFSFVLTELVLEFSTAS